MMAGMVAGVGMAGRGIFRATEIRSTGKVGGIDGETHARVLSADHTPATVRVSRIRDIVGDSRHEFGAWREVMVGHEDFQGAGIVGRAAVDEISVDASGDIFAGSGVEPDREIIFRHIYRMPCGIMQCEKERKILTMVYADHSPSVVRAAGRIYVVMVIWHGAFDIAFMNGFEGLSARCTS